MGGGWCRRHRSDGVKQCRTKPILFASVFCVLWGVIGWKKKLAKMAILLVRAKFQIVQNSDHKDECDLLQENLVEGHKPLTEVEPTAIPCWQLKWGANGARAPWWVKSYRDNRGVGLIYGFLRSLRRNRLLSSKATSQAHSSAQEGGWEVTYVDPY